MMETETSSFCPNCFSGHYQGGHCSDCGYADPGTGTGQALPPGVMLGNRYLLGRVLGIGGFGITYKAFDTLYREVCAVKEFAPSQLAYRRPGEYEMTPHNSACVSHFQHGMQRFMEEAQVLKQLRSVPAVVQVKECFQENRTAYYVMEFLDGTDLRGVIKTMGGVVSAADITGIIVQIGSAMDVIHRTTGILHRDISPDNIYLLKNGSVRLLDFGSARQQTMDERQDFTIQFKKGFAPPEQYSRSQKQGPYTDVYALASTYYYALTGVMVPDAMDRLGEKTYLPLCQIRKDITPQVSDAVDKALELDWRRRTQTMGEFVRGIDRQSAEIKTEVRKKERKQIPYLEVLAGSNVGLRWSLPANTEICIGRSPRMSNIIISGNPLISKRHCRLAYDEVRGEFLLTDLNSKNGVRVDGRLLEPQKTYRYPAKLTFSLADGACIFKAGVSYESEH